MRAVFETEVVNLVGGSPQATVFGTSTLPQVTAPGSSGPFTFSHTAPGAGTDSAIVVFVIMRLSTFGGHSTVTFNGVSCPFFATTDTGDTETYRIESFVLANPAAGAHNVSISLIGSPSFMGAFAISLTSVDQTTPIFGSAVTPSDSPVSPINTIITVPSGGFAIDGVIVSGAGATLTIQNAATEIFNVADDFGAFGRLAAGYKADASQLGWAFTGAGSYRQLVVAVNPAAAGGGGGDEGHVFEAGALPDVVDSTGQLIPPVHMQASGTAYEIYDRGSGVELIPRVTMTGVGHGGTLGLGSGQLVPHPIIGSQLIYNTNALTVAVADAIAFGDQQNTLSVQNETVVESMVLSDESAVGAVLTADQQEVITILDVRDVSFSTDLQRSEQFIISDSQDCTVDPAPNSVNMVEPVGFADYSDVDVIGAPAEGRTVALPASTHNPRTVTHVFKPAKQSDEQDYFGFDFTKVLSFGEEIRTMPGYAPVVQMQLRRGTDPLPEDMITGMPVFVAGPLVYLKVVGGLNRNDYMLSVEINTNKGRRLPAYGVIRVRDPRVH